MSSSRPKNFRRRTTSDDSTADDSKPTPKSQKKPNPKPVNRLSFADDDEDEDPNSGPTAVRHRPTKTPIPISIHKISSSKNHSSSALKPLISPNVQPQAGEYTKGRLLELQKNARPLGSMPKTSKPETLTEPVIVLKGLLKPESLVGSDADSKKVEDEEEEEEEDDRNEVKGLSKMLSQAVP